VPSLRHINEVKGAYVKQERGFICTVLGHVARQAIYTDTDSIIFIQPRDEPALVETGDKLGQMTSELKPDEIILEVVCAGSKNYAHKTIPRQVRARPPVKFEG
jgi:hypothetical protein